jgi:hypothetical protein
VHSGSGRRHNDLCRVEKVFDGVLETVPDAVVTAPLQDVAAVEDKLSLRINGGSWWIRIRRWGGWAGGGA